MLLMTIAQTGLRDHIFAPVECHEVDQHLCRPGNYERQSISTGLFCKLQSLQTNLANKKEARKNDMPLLRYATLGLANVVVAPATFWTRRHNVFGTKTQHRQHFGLGQYRIRIGCVSDMLHGTFYMYF